MVSILKLTPCLSKPFLLLALPSEAVAAQDHVPASLARHDGCGGTSWRVRCDMMCQASPTTEQPSSARSLRAPLTHVALAEADVTPLRALVYGVVGHGLGMFSTASVEHADLWHWVIHLFGLKALI